jgi:hypothetical protein
MGTVTELPDWSRSSMSDRLALMDDLSDVIAMARGVEAAIDGLECEDEEIQGGVLMLYQAHIARLQTIQGRLIAMFEMNKGVPEDDADD